VNIYEFSVKNPVTITMIFIAIILSGIGAATQLPQELFPSVTFPQLTIVTPYSNAAPEEIETLVTKLVEESIATVKNLKAIRSFSREGISLVIAEFNWGTDMNFASLNLREKIDLIKERLPRDAEEPLVLKFNPFSKPIMVYSLTSKGDPSDPSTYKMTDILKLARKQIKDKLEKVPGVASISISGGQEREIHVNLDLNKLISHGINILDVPTALKNSNLNYPAGSVKEEFYEFLVRTMGEYQTLKDIENTLVSIENIKKGVYEKKYRKAQEKSGERRSESSIRDTSSRFVLLKDIAEVKDTFKERSSYSRYLGKENISLVVQKQASANTIKTVKLVKQELYRLTNDSNIIPPQVDMKLIYDESMFIKTAISGVVKAALMGGVLAVIVLFIFLGNIQSSLIVASTIPVSVLASFILMYLKGSIFHSGISINMMSLGGLALGIGMLVDNAIVVVENIERHKSMGKSLINAAIHGGQEVFSSIFSSTLTTLAVFFPLAFVGGISGELFSPISWTIGFSLMASLIAAVTLIPRLTIIQIGNSKIQTESGNIMRWIEDTIGNLLNQFMKISKIGLFLSLCLFLASLLLLSTFETEIMPKVDQRQFNIKVTLPTGTILEKTNEVTKIIEEELFSNPDVIDVNINQPGIPEEKKAGISVAVGSDKSGGKASLNSLGSHQSLILVRLKKIPKGNYIIQLRDLITSLIKKFFHIKENKPPSTHEIIQNLNDTMLKKKMNSSSTALKIAEIVYTSEDNMFAGAFDSNSAISINITGKNLDSLKELVTCVESKLETVTGVYNIRNDIPSKSPEYRIIPDRSRAAMNGISASDIAQTALISLKGNVATRLKKDGTETNVLVRLKKSDRKSQTSIQNIPLFLEDTTLPLRDLATIIAGRGPSEIKRLDQIKIFHVYADVDTRIRSEADALKEIEPLLNIKNLVYEYKKFSQEKKDGLYKKVKENYFTGYGQEYKDKQKSTRNMLYAFILSITLVYMIMASQFESLWQPFIIMMTVPLSVIGVALSLFLTNTSLNAMSMLGLIMLGGIVVNNGIVLIQFINDLREEGEPLKDSIITGVKTRLRPILMTTMTTLLGLMPLALKLESGSEFQSPMAIAVIGGLLVSTCLTLFIVPAFYYVSETFILKIKKRQIM